VPKLRTDRRRERLALVQMLEGGRAHLTLADALRRFPAVHAGRLPHGAPHSAWQLLEHLRIAQRDILDFSLDPDHESPPWPDGYWPATPAPPNARAWRASVRTFLRDLAELVAIARDPRRDLAAPIAGTTTSWLGQLTLAGGHNAYHVGQLVMLSKMFERAQRRPRRARR
jgi:hypothetical protein